MKAQEELQKILLYEAQIECKLEELERLNSLATKMTAAMGNEVVSGTRNLDPMGTTADKIMLLRDEIKRLKAAYEGQKSYFSRIIDDLKNPLWIRVLYGHYYHGKSFRTLAGELGYTKRNICYIHGDALVAVEKAMKNE